MVSETSKEGISKIIMVYCLKQNLNYQIFLLNFLNETFKKQIRVFFYDKKDL